MDELEAKMRKKLKEDFPSIAKYIQIKRVVGNPNGEICITYRAMKLKVIPPGPQFWLENYYFQKFTQVVRRFKKTLDDFKVNGERVCDECQHYLDKYKYVAAMIPFRNLDENLPTRLRCTHIIENPIWERIDDVHRREHLFRILPLPIANEIMLHIE